MTNHLREIFSVHSPFANPVALLEWYTENSSVTVIFWLDAFDGSSIIRTQKRQNSDPSELTRIERVRGVAEANILLITFDLGAIF